MGDVRYFRRDKCHAVECTLVCTHLLFRLIFEGCFLLVMLHITSLILKSTDIPLKLSLNFYGGMIMQSAQVL